MFKILNIIVTADSMKIEVNRKKQIIFFLFFITIFIGIILVKIDLIRDKNDDRSNLKEVILDEHLLKKSNYWNLTNTPLFIDDWIPNCNWKSISSKNEWCSGSGTFNDPYILENIIIDGKKAESCITIRNSDAYFIIKNCTLYNAGYSIFNSEAAIKLVNTKNGKIVNNNCSLNQGFGIYQFFCFNNTISKNQINYNSHYGIYSLLSSKNIIMENEIKYNEINGIYFWFCDMNNISENFIDFNQNGINLVFSHKNLITNNYLVNNGNNIYQFRCYENLIQDNRYEYEKPTSNINKEEETNENEEKDQDPQEIPTLSLLLLSTTIAMLSGGIISYVIYKRKIQKTSIIPIKKSLKEKPKLKSIPQIEKKSKPELEIKLLPDKAIVKFKDLKKINKDENL